MPAPPASVLPVRTCQCRVPVSTVHPADGTPPAYLRRAGLPHTRFHDLRHACATLLLLQGVELKVVQEILGHASISTTGNIYAHVLQSLKRGAADSMDVVLTRRWAAR